MIIQGSNNPIVLQFSCDMSNVQKFSAVLFAKQLNRPLKIWSIDDVEFSAFSATTGTTTSLPLTEAETLLFPHGRATIEVKWLQSDTNIMFAEVAHVDIVHRSDKTKLMTSAL